RSIRGRVPFPIEPKPIITMGPSMVACTGQLVIQTTPIGRGAAPHSVGVVRYHSLPALGGRNLTEAPGQAGRCQRRVGKTTDEIKRRVTVPPCGGERGVRPVP